MFGGIMPLPQLTDEQRKAALEKAAAARHARAELRDKIKKGEMTLEEVLDSDDPIASRMKVSALIESLPGYGKAKAAKIMNELGISATRRVKGLGARQREQLLEALTK
jgi:signal recognition particle GTPase